MVTARCYECPSCGGLVREVSRHCNYCGSPVATVRCARCYMMNVAEALHCIGCGADLGLMPLRHEDSADWACPRCQTQRLDAFGSEVELLFDCARCGGQFLPHHVLKLLVQRHQAAPLAPTVRLRPHNPFAERVTYLPCPSCHELMNRRNFGSFSGIVVDVCSVHGTWFDVGELVRILAFVGQGGLEIGRSTNHGLSRALVAVPKRVSPVSLLDASSVDESLSWNDMREAALAFARWVQGMLR